MAKVAHPKPTPIVTVIHEPDEQAMVTALKIALGIRRKPDCLQRECLPKSITQPKKAVNQ